MKSYKEDIAEEMEWLGKQDDVRFLGQSVAYPGHYLTQTLSNVPREKCVELGVAEELQMGMTLGLALGGFFPVSIYPRMDFLLLALNQLVNHIDKIQEMTGGEFTPRGIIRTSVGPKKPLDAGPQHTNRYSKEIASMCKHIRIIELNSPVYKPKQSYCDAYDSKNGGFYLFIEEGDFY